MSKFLHPTVEVKTRHGELRRLSIIERSPDGLMVKYAVLGCNATPVWVSTESLRPLVQAGKVL